MGDILDDERKARHRDTVRALYNAVTDHLRELENENERLRGALEGEIRGDHVYNGLCPEDEVSLSSRDPDCPQCQRLSAALGGEG